MSYYLFNRQKILQKAEERYSKEKATEYYLQNKEAIKETSKNRYKNLSKEEKNKITENQKKKDISNWFSTKKSVTEWVLSLLSIKMSKKTLKFDNIKVNKKEFHKSKQPINLDLVKADQVVVSDKFKHSDDGFKYFIGYKEGEIAKPLRIISPQVSGYIKYFENGGKNMSFMVKNDD